MGIPAEILKAIADTRKMAFNNNMNTSIYADGINTLAHENDSGIVDVADLASENDSAITDLADYIAELEARIELLERR